jgi:hypothetical protein
MNTPQNIQPKPKPKSPRHEVRPRRVPPDLYQIVIECRDEAHQRDLFERLQSEGLKLRLLVL